MALPYDREGFIDAQDVLLDLLPRRSEAISAHDVELVSRLDTEIIAARELPNGLRAPG
jgi:hypothetical protein